MALIINDELIRKCGGGSGEYWFSYSTQKVKNIKDLDTYNRPEDMSQTEYFLSINVIPFLSVPSEEIVRHFVEEKANKKLVNALKKVDSGEYMDTFWKYFDAYEELKDGFEDYVQVYVKNKVIDWCNENNVQYVIE